MIKDNSLPRDFSWIENYKLYYLERWYCFSGKYHIFSLEGKWKILFLRKYMEIWYFLYTGVNVTNMILPFCKKKQRWSSPEKIHLKVIDILDRILERVSMILCTFMETFIGVFICLEIFYNEESSILCTIQLSGVVFRGMLERQLRKLFVH